MSGRRLAYRIREVERSIHILCDKQKNEKAHYNVLIERLKKSSHELKVCYESMSVLKTVGSLCQQYSVTSIESMVSEALKDVFGKEAYKFKIDVFQTKKGMSVDFFFDRGGQRFDILECCGYGQVDVACFALQIAMYNLCPESPLLLFDEPFKFVSAKHRRRTAMLVKKISDTLNVQFVILTHMTEFLEFGDKCFVCTQNEGIREQ